MRPRSHCSADPTTCAHSVAKRQFDKRPFLERRSAVQSRKPLLGKLQRLQRLQRIQIGSSLFSSSRPDQPHISSELDRAGWGHVRGTTLQSPAHDPPATLLITSISNECVTGRISSYGIHVPSADSNLQDDVPRTPPLGVAPVWIAGYRGALRHRCRKARFGNR